MDFDTPTISVYISDLSLSLPSLFLCKQLRDSGIKSNRINGTLPIEWSSISQMKNLFDSKLSKTVIVETEKKVHILNRLLADNLLTGSLPEEWLALSNLVLLSAFFLPRALFSSSILIDFSHSSDCSENQLDGPLPAQWSSLRKLDQLFLSLLH